MGRTQCHKPLPPSETVPHKINKTQAHQKYGCPRAACAPALTDTHTPLYLDKYKQIHNLLRCRYEDRRGRAWVTRGSTSPSPT